MPLLSVKNLCVEFPLRGGTVTAIRDMSYDLERGERLGIVGESGAGKSVSAFAILNLLSRPGRISSGSITFDGTDLVRLDESGLRKIRGNQISMIFQDPMMTLNPVLSIGVQLQETLLAHRSISRSEARSIALEKLQAVQIPSPETRLQQYPHELSGGMRQRVVIAAALLTEPKIIIADEPTTALDVTIQAEILSLLVHLCKSHEMSLILITHDLGVVCEITRRVLVMYAGRIIEDGATAEIVNGPMHPYTKGLIDALPEKTRPGHALNQIPGVMPTLQNIPTGCAFHPCCTSARPLCAGELPTLQASEGRMVACHFPLSQRQP